MINANIPTPTFSIVSSWFNVEKMKFDWRGALQNWLAFQRGAGEIIIAVNTSEDDSANLIRNWVSEFKMDNPTNFTKVEVIDIEIPYTDPEFDGKGKATATAKATERFVILLDCDERIVPSSRDSWLRLAMELEVSKYEGFLIPVIDLIEDEKKYKSIGTKWYIHKNLPHISRGVVKWARREDGSIDKTKSDTCEAINKDTGELINSAHIMMMELPDWMKVAQMESGEVPFVYHLGFLDLEQRLRQSDFWRPVWDLRDKASKEPEMTLEKLQAMNKARHNLPTWRTQ